MAGRAFLMRPLAASDSRGQDGGGGTVCMAKRQHRGAIQDVARLACEDEEKRGRDEALERTSHATQRHPDGREDKERREETEGGRNAYAPSRR